MNPNTILEAPPQTALSLTLVRHGETYQNVDQIVQGQHPLWGRLTPEGIRQCSLLGERLSEFPFQIAHCSTLERAVLTLALMLVPRKGKHTVPLRFAAELREIHQGNLHGRPHTEWRQAMAPHDPMRYRAQGGESWEDVQARMMRYLQHIIRPSGKREVLLVAHGGVNRALLAGLLGIPLGQAWRGPAEGCPQDNSCLNRIHLDASGRVLDALVNDSLHLQGHFASASAGQRWLPDERRFVLLGEVPAAGRAAEFDPYG